MKFLGIDPGYGITGYGLIEFQPQKMREPILIEAGVLRSDPAKPLSERLQEIYRGLLSILEEFSPEEMAVEEIYSVKTFPRSAIAIGNVRGVILLAAAENKIPVFSYFPIQIKKALLGYGRSTKVQMQKMIQRTLGLDSVPQPDDAADALAVALCHANRIRYNRTVRNSKS